MKIQRSRVIAFMGVLALMAGSVPQPATAQEKRVEKKRPDEAFTIEPSIPFVGPPDLQDLTSETAFTIKFLEAKFAFDKLVKGAAYSAVAVTETTQTLSDGNQITRNCEVTMYRDSEGRTRREQTLEGVKNWPAAGDPPRMIFINDPISGYNYVLDPRTRTARKTMGSRKGKPVDPIYNEKEKMIEKLDKAGRKMATKPVSTEPDENGPPHKTGKPEGKKLGTDIAPGQDGPTVARPAKPATAEGLTVARPAKKRAPAEGETISLSVKREISTWPKKTESLGKQIIEGVEAEGTRSTTTIPAGEIGNRLPIEIVDERWYSPELQVLLMSKHHDPRSGETIYRLTNINRSEPDRSLFEIPSDYTLNDVTKPRPVESIKKPEDE